MVHIMRFMLTLNENINYDNFKMNATVHHKYKENSISDYALVNIHLEHFPKDYFKMPHALQYSSHTKKSRLHYCAFELSIDLTFDWF